MSAADDAPSRDERSAWPPSEAVAVARELDEAGALELLGRGELELQGRLVASSNAAFVGTVSLPDDDARVRLAPCVYKPVRGERPLWDFPDGTLAAREVAAFEVSRATPWAIVPPTLLRPGRFGPGMVQLWLEPDPTADPVAMVVDGDERLRPMALFDTVINNADRKVGHLLPQPDGHVLGVDHGICFHDEPKLRTVLWRWQGERLRDDELAVLGRLREALGGGLGERLARLLAPEEVAAVGRRLADLLAAGRFPYPDPDRPAIPWPPY